MKEVISDKQGICITTLFILGSTLVIGMGGAAKQNAWMSTIVSIFYAFPIVLCYSRLLSLFPRKNLYDISEVVLGKYIGKVICVVYIWYSFHLGTLVLRNFSEFTNIQVLPDTPVFVPMLFYVFLCILAVKAGIEVIGRWSELYIILVLFLIILITFIMSASQMDINNLRPVFGKDIKIIFTSAFNGFAFPYAETIVMTLVFSSLKSKKSSYKIYIISLVLGGAVLLSGTLRNIMILGIEGIERNYFPSYIAISLIHIGEFIQRMELSVAVVFLVGGFVKISICLLAMCNGIKKLFNLDDYRFIVLPAGLWIFYMNFVLYENTMEMVDWAFKVYPYYAFPFQVIIPIIILIGAEIKVGKFSKI